MEEFFNNIFDYFCYVMFFFEFIYLFIRVDKLEKDVLLIKKELENEKKKKYQESEKTCPKS